MDTRKAFSKKCGRRKFRLSGMPAVSRVLLALILCLLTCMGIFDISSQAAEDPDNKGINRVTFTNGANHTPDLYITKEVTSADASYQAPDIAFLFTLKLDGELASGIQYRLFGADGTEVFNYAADGNVIPFSTSRSGDFYLKAGQTAKFEYVGTGIPYEVTEGSAENFTQVIPAGGTAASGTVLADGSSAKFVNRYVPDVPDKPIDPDPEPETTKLTISKYISFPHKFVLPQDTPEFGFTLRIDGKPYAGQLFTIVDNEYGEPKEDGSIGMTDKKGHFTIPGGHTAVFEEVPADVEYYVSEDKLEGWRVIGKALREGATRKPLTEINYTNATASFAVTKSVRRTAGSGNNGTSSDTWNAENEKKDRFTFTLLDGQKNTWGGAAYYLYTTDGQQVTDAGGKAIKGETDARGCFTLTDGQAAVFIGMSPGTVYSVKEQAAKGYVQAVPKSASGYVDKTVKASVEIVPFVNEPEEEEDEKSLTVTKLVENETRETSKEEDIFTFILSKKQADGSYAPVAGSLYSITVGGATRTYRTDSEGRFRIEENETARFTQLIPDSTYRVEETELGAEYHIEESQKVQEGVLIEKLAFTFTNTYVSTPAGLAIRKTDEKGNVLAGAGFTLYADADKNVTVAEGVTGEDGLFIIPDIDEGTYYLEESRAPQGYEAIAGMAELSISRDDITGKLVVSAKLDEKGDTDTDGSLKVAVEEGMLDESGRKKDEITVTVENFLLEKPIEPQTASLTVTKHLEDISGKAVAVAGRTYYVALFDDEEREKRISEVKELQFDRSSKASVTFENLSAGKTYYVGETDKKGVLLLSYASDSEACIADYPDGYTVQAKEGGQAAVLSFKNIFSKFPPEKFYYSGKLTVTKKAEKDGKAYQTDKTFYAGVYSDKGCTVPVGSLIRLNMAGASETSVTVEVPIGSSEKDVRTYYIRETDADGNVLDANGASIGFAASYDKESVEMNWRHRTADITITNTFVEEESGTRENAGTARTADETPLEMLCVLLAASALVMITGAVYALRRRRQ